MDTNIYLYSVSYFADAFCKVTEGAFELLYFFGGEALLAFFRLSALHFVVECFDGNAEVGFGELAPGDGNKDVLDFGDHIGCKIFVFHGVAFWIGK